MGMGLVKGKRKKGRKEGRMEMKWKRKENSKCYFVPVTSLFILIFIFLCFKCLIILHEMVNKINQFISIMYTFNKYLCYQCYVHIISFYHCINKHKTKRNEIEESEKENLCVYVYFRAKESKNGDIKRKKADRIEYREVKKKKKK